MQPPVKQLKQIDSHPIVIQAVAMLIEQLHFAGQSQLNEITVNGCVVEGVFKKSLLIKRFNAFGLQCRPVVLCLLLILAGQL